MSSQPETSEPGQIITFYSYKGGTGRSMALANVACLLAQRQEGYGGVLVVDWDLEAPGLHSYFASKFQRRFSDPSTAAASLKGHPGLIEFFSVLREHVEKLPVISDEPSPQVQQELAEAAPLDSFILPTDIPNLWLMKAGAFDQDYAKRVNTFPWEALYARAPWLVPWVVECLTARFRYTLVDSRTGITDTSGICTMLMPDKLVTVFTPNQQSLDGVLQLAERAANYRRTSSDLRPLSVFPLPSRIEKDVVQLAEWRKGDGNGYQPRFEALFEKIWDLKDCNLEAYLNEVQIQHSPDYAFGEKVSVLIETGDNRLGLKRSYASFTERLITMNAPWESLVPTAGPPQSPEVQQAEHIYAQLTPEQQDSARRLFLQLVCLPQNSAKAMAREVNSDELSEDARAICSRFAEQKMLRSRIDDGHSWVSLSGETLLANWRKLTEWIEADLDFLHWRDGLDATLANWEKFKRDKEGLLRGHPLEEAVQRKNQRAKDLNQAEIFYIDTSLATSIRKRRLNYLYAAVAACILGLIIFIMFRSKAVSHLADARILILQDPGVSAAIRAERLYSKSEDIDDALRLRLRFTPNPVNAYHVNGPANLISFSPDGSHVAVASESIVSCFSLDAPDPVFTMRHAGPVQSLEFSADGIWLASGSADKTRKLRNIRNGSENSIPFGSPVTAIAFSSVAAPKTFIATATDVGKVYLSTIPDTKTITLTHRDSVSALAFSPNGSALVTASADKTAQLWTTDTGRNFGILEHPGAVQNVLYSPDGRYVATGANDGKARIWLSQKDAPALSESEAQGSLFQLAFSPDGNRLATIGTASLRVSEVPTGKVLFRETTSAQPAALLFNSNLAVVALRSGTISSLSLPAKSNVWHLAQKSELVSVVFSRDGKYVGASSKDGAFIVWKLDPSDRKKYSSLTGTALADAACLKLKPILSTDPDLKNACP